MRLLFLIGLCIIGSSGVGDKIYREKIKNYKTEIESGEWMQVPSPGPLGLKAYYDRYSEESRKDGPIYWGAYKKVVLKKNIIFNDSDPFSSATIQVPKPPEKEAQNQDSAEDSLFNDLSTHY